METEVFREQQAEVEDEITHRERMDDAIAYEMKRIADLAHFIDHSGAGDVNER